MTAIDSEPHLQDLEDQNRILNKTKCRQNEDKMQDWSVLAILYFMSFIHMLKTTKLKGSGHDHKIFNMLWEILFHDEKCLWNLPNRLLYPFFHPFSDFAHKNWHSKCVTGVNQPKSVQRAFEDNIFENCRFDSFECVF